VAAGTPALHPFDDIVSTTNTDHLTQRREAPAFPRREVLPPLATPNGFSYKPNGTATTLCERETDLECLDCGHLHAVSPNSSSSLCSRCGSYTSLKNYDIREPWTRQIRTRGNVHVHENGSLTDTSVTCNHLTIDGDFNGVVECTGDLIIRKSCRILGHIRCRRLIVENKASVVCASGIQAKEVVVDGSVEADITCDGRLELARKASLTGDINIAKLIINEGAAHQGRVSMVCPTRR
jgi:cytoskeletal protein CcmA (bactofilin family)